MRYFGVTWEWHRGRALVAVDFGRERFYRYVASTGKLHLEQGLSNDYLFGDDGAEFTELSQGDARRLMLATPPYDLTSPRKRFVLAQYERQLEQTPGDVLDPRDAGLIR